MEKEKQTISSEIRPLLFEISLSKGKSVDNIIENNQEFLNKYNAKTISSFIKIVVSLEEKIREEKDLNKKRKIIEFALENMYNSLIDLNLFFIILQSIIRNEIEKKEIDEDKIYALKRHYMKQKSGFILIINKLFSKLENIYLELTNEYEYDHELEFNQQTNEQKIYNLTLLFFDFINNEFDYDYTVDTYYNKILIYKKTVFTRNAIEKDDIKNIDFNLLNFEQIKEIFDILGPKMSIFKTVYILQKINDLDMGEKVLNHLKDNLLPDFYKELQSTIDKSFIETAVNNISKELEKISIDKSKLITELQNDYIISIFNHYITSRGFLVNNINNKLEVSFKLSNLDYKTKCKFINELTDKCIDGGVVKVFIDKISSACDLYNVDDTFAFITEEEPDKKSKKSKKNKKISKKKEVKITDDEIDSAYKQTDIEDIGKLDTDKIWDIKSKLTEKNINKIRSDFFHEPGVLFDELFYKIDGINPTMYSTIIFNFIKDYLFFIAGYIIKDIGHFTMVLQGGAAVQYFSNAKRKTTDLDFTLYSTTTIDKIKEKLASDFLPYFSDDVINIKEILLNREPLFNFPEIKKYYEANIKFGIEKLTADATTFKLYYKFDDKRKIVKIYIDIDGIGGPTISKCLIDISLYTDILPNNQIYRFPFKSDDKDTQILIKILKKELLLLKIKSYILDYDKLIKDKNFRNPKYIKEVPDIDIQKTIEFIGIKAKSQLDALNEADKTPSLPLKDGRKYKSRKSTVKRKSRKNKSTRKRKTKSRNRKSTEKLRRKSIKRKL